MGKNHYLVDTPRYIIYVLYLGDIVTEIKMTVGQGDSRSKLDAGKDIIRVPPPVDISSAPSHALAGKGNL